MEDVEENLLFSVFMQRKRFRCSCILSFFIGFNNFLGNYKSKNRNFLILKALLERLAGKLAGDMKFVLQSNLPAENITPV